LYEQFEDDYSGLGKKASHKDEEERTSDEFFLHTPNGNPNEKASFTVRFDTDSIPDNYLYPDLWKNAFLKKGLETKIDEEREKFRNAGTLIRTRNNRIDTLYGYAYKLNMVIVLNYYKKGGDDAIHTTFTVPAQTVVYHQLKL
jgi:hypothetical protein